MLYQGNAIEKTDYYLIAFSNISFIGFAYVFHSWLF